MDNKHIVFDGVIFVILFFSILTFSHLDKNEMMLYIETAIKKEFSLQSSQKGMYIYDHIEDWKDQDVDPYTRPSFSLRKDIAESEGRLDEFLNTYKEAGLIDE